MERMFGIPMDQLARAIVVLLAVCGGILAVLIARNRVFLKLATRSIVRRKGRTTLIVVGLMLATTIISASLVTGDTMTSTIRSSVIESLGNTDEKVTVRGAQDERIVELGGASGESYIDESLLRPIYRAAETEPLIDGYAPAIIEPVAARNERSRSNEPRVTLFGADPQRIAAFGAVTTTGGDEVTFAQLEPGEAYLNRDGADELDAEVGDELTLMTGAGTATAAVRAIVDYNGAGTEEAALLVTLDDAQRALDRGGFVDHVLISNVGDEVTGAVHTDAVVESLEAKISPRGLEAQPVKQDGLDAAESEGNAFMSLFTTFGSFSIVAGILLIFLIFVMLAAERRGELGVARAVGTKRGHLVQMFLFEGAAYDVLAAAVGALLGIAVSFAMVSIVANGFGTEINIERSVEMQSLVVAYGLGVLLTLLVVTVSAWRVSVLNIVTAVRNLPDPMTVHKGKRRWLKAAVSIAFGALFIMSGASANVAMPFMLGVSLVVIGIALAARAAGVPDRLALTIGGLLLVGWWLLPFGVIDAMLDEPKMDFSIWIVSGIMLVVGATWVVMYNADALLGAAVAAGGRVRRLAPVLKMALAYPLRSRFRTGVSLAMFTLVVFTLVCGSAISNSYLTAADDIERFGGGFDLRAGTPSVSPIGDIEGAIASEPSLSAADYTAVGSEALVPLEARQADTKNGFESYPVRGADATYLQTTTYRMAATARGYDDAQAVWHAVAETPGLAVVDSWVVPHRDNFGFAVLPDFQLSGFYVEDGTFEPIDVVLRDPNTRTTVTLTVIGVLDDGAPFEQAGITTAMEVLKPFGPRVQPTMYYAQLADGVDSDNAAKQLEAAFFDQGMEAESMQSLLDAAVGESLTFQYLILGFMGLGLVVGVAALGVIGARAVVERRQHIGVLRAIGFQPAMVRMTFLIEASFIALTAITIGTVLGLILGYNVIDDSRNTASWSDMEFVVPWAQFFVVFVVVYLAVLITTFSPAVRASKVYPAEALRYE